MNINYENDELRPYEEPRANFDDEERIGSFLIWKKCFDYLFCSI